MRYPEAQKSVVAHSYGTLVATEAAEVHGLLADDLWLLGSAGVAGHSVADLTLASPDALVYSVEASADVIARAHSGPDAVLGASPTAPGYGSALIENVEGKHSDYFSDPVFLNELARAGTTQPGST